MGATEPLQKLKFINFVDVDEDTCELQFYGEVVKTRPNNGFFSDKKATANFVCEDEILEEIKKCEGKKNLVMRINSPGGDFFTGIAICNRIKQLNCENKTAYVDGLAASAASVIAMGADKIIMPSSACMMLHEVKSFVGGYVDSEAVERTKNMLECFNSQAAELYAQKTGKTTKEIRKTMKNETWLTGRQAFDQGWIDEVLEDTEENAVNCIMSADHQTLMVNGYAFNVAGFGNMPNFPTMGTKTLNIPQLQNVQRIAPANKSEKENKQMEIKTIEDLRNAYPTLVQQLIETESKNAVNSAVIAERKRIEEITEIQNQIGDSELVKNAMFGETTMSAKDLAFEAMKKQSVANADFLSSRQNAAEQTNGINSTPNAGTGGIDTAIKNDVELTPEQRILKGVEEARNDLGGN